MQVVDAWSVIATSGLALRNRERQSLQRLAALSEAKCGRAMEVSTVGALLLFITFSVGQGTLRKVASSVSAHRMALP